MAVEFYNVKLRQKVSVDESKVKKVEMDTRGGKRYALKAEHEGTPMTKFISKDTYDTLDVAKG